MVRLSCCSSYNLSSKQHLSISRPYPPFKGSSDSAGCDGRSMQVDQPGNWRARSSHRYAGSPSPFRDDVLCTMKALHRCSNPGNDSHCAESSRVLAIGLNLDWSVTDGFTALSRSSLAAHAVRKNPIIQPTGITSLTAVEGYATTVTP